VGVVDALEEGNKNSGVGVSENYIDAMVQGGVEWRFTGVYGEPRWEHKQKTWEMLCSLHTSVARPWVVAGDFNEILYNEEKEGGRPRTQRQLQAFHDALNTCQLSDMGYEGDMFTWQRGRVRERLDRAVANAEWRQMFPNARVVNCEMLKSDHRPVSIDTEGMEGLNMRDGPRRFEVRWLKEETVEEIIKNRMGESSNTRG
jgi:hypothetical protein